MNYVSPFWGLKTYIFILTFNFNMVLTMTTLFSEIWTYCITHIDEIKVTFFLSSDPTHSEDFYQPDPVMMVSAGDNVTLRCFFLIDHTDPITWYKQTSGHQPRAVAMMQKLAKTPHFFENFKSSRFSIETDTEKCHLRISNVTSSDEAVYYCSWRKYETHFAGGTYLALKGLCFILE